MAVIYVTRYALSRGIIRVEAELQPNGTARVTLNSRRPATFLAAKDFALTAEEAIARGEAMRVRRIQHLQRQLRRLEGHGIELLDARAR